MKEMRLEDKRLVRYLLGEPLAESDLNEIEDLYFSDDPYFSFLLETEDEIIDEYLRGGLSLEQRRQFETHFLASPRRRERWEAQKQIQIFFLSRREAATPGIWHRWLAGFRLAAAPASAAFVLAIVFSFVGGFAYRERAARVAQQEGQPVAALREKAPVSARDAVLELEPRLRSDAKTAAFHRAEGTQWVTIRLKISPQYAGAGNFTATLQTPDGDEVWKVARLHAVDDRVIAVVPTNLLEPGAWIVSLVAGTGAATRELPSYEFEVR